MNRRCNTIFVIRILLCIALFTSGSLLKAQSAPDDSDARPPVERVDLEIVERARQILGAPSKWNRADNRVCPETAKTFSLYCALEKATVEKVGTFAHRGAAMQEARFVIDEIAPNANQYEHRLMNYNNDPTTTFADVGKFFDLLEDHIAKRLAGLPVEKPTPASTKSEPPHESTETHTADSPGSKRLGDLLIGISTIAIPTASSANADRYYVSLSGTIQNVGKNPVCTPLTAKVETSLKLQETATIRIDHDGGTIREMLPGEVANVNFDASIKNGTDPLKLTVSQPTPQQGCGNHSHIIFNTEVSIPITVPPGQNPSGAVHPGAVTPPRALHKTDPDYPVEAAAGQSGSVVISAIVGADGTVHDPKVIRSLGQGFDEKALEAVKEWKFEPTTKDGRKIPVTVNIEVNFRPR